MTWEDSLDKISLMFSNLRKLGINNCEELGQRIKEIEEHQRKERLKQDCPACGCSWMEHEVGGRCNTWIGNKGESGICGCTKQPPQ